MYPYSCCSFRNTSPRIPSNPSPRIPTNVRCISRSDPLSDSEANDSDNTEPESVGDAEIKQKFIRKQTSKAPMRLPTAWNRNNNASTIEVELLSTDRPSAVVTESAIVLDVRKVLPSGSQVTDESSTDDEQSQENEICRRRSSVDFVKKTTSRKLKRRDERKKQRAVVAAVVTLVTTSLHRG